jgi:hypothetical protein
MAAATAAAIGLGHRHHHGMRATQQALEGGHGEVGCAEKGEANCLGGQNREAADGGSLSSVSRRSAFFRFCA